MSLEFSCLELQMRFGQLCLAQFGLGILPTISFSYFFIFLQTWWYGHLTSQSIDDEIVPFHNIRSEVWFFTDRPVTKNLWYFKANALIIIYESQFLQSHWSPVFMSFVSFERFNFSKTTLPADPNPVFVFKMIFFEIQFFFKV